MERHGVEPPQDSVTLAAARHLTVLDSLRCTVCGVGVGSSCDVVAHQVWGIATFSCSRCGAVAGEPCEPECEPDAVLASILNNFLAN